MQAGGRIDISIECVIITLDGLLLKQMSDQLCLTHSSCRCQQDVGFIFKRAHHPCRFFLPITEIRLWYDAGNVKRILHIALFWVQK